MSVWVRTLVETLLMRIRSFGVPTIWGTHKTVVVTRGGEGRVSDVKS